MTNMPPPASTRAERLIANIEILCGKGDYDFEEESQDYSEYWTLVRRDHGTWFGDVLFMTKMCSSSESAWAELDRVLDAGARKKQSSEQ
ncbi:hypothetical protein B0T10DRAFT_485366 [Thelonectria olida]|uniref:Uncharacterized protein n=1 Tax=Thelonectria olida TaxID=1576542 RepID=A0A9P8W7T5_9HYPO|nr:hypothetical protein B0T10DRAFT_485366 [Thelonectria olida]